MMRFDAHNCTIRMPFAPFQSEIPSFVVRDHYNGPVSWGLIGEETV
jgi:hypothetical protein